MECQPWDPAREPRTMSHAPMVCEKGIFRVSFFNLTLRFHPRSRPFVRLLVRPWPTWLRSEPYHGVPRKRLQGRLLILDPRPLFTLVLFLLRWCFLVFWKPLLICFCALVLVLCPFKRFYYVIHSCLDISATAIFFVPRWPLQRGSTAYSYLMFKLWKSCSMSILTEDICLPLWEPLYNLIKSFSNCVTQ